MEEHQMAANGNDQRDDIAARYHLILERVARACGGAGRPAEDVRVIGVTKMKPADVVRAACDAGITDIGENYVQELAEKHAALGEIVRWHFIGHLQRNKVSEIIPFIGMIHGVDSERLATEISKRATAIGRRIPVLAQVNTSGEESKHGIAPEELIRLAEHMAGLPGIELQGLMTIPAIFDDPEGVRPMFRMLRELRDRARTTTGLPLPHLSMGMTGDFEAAIEEGATMVRIGTALFGGRA